LGYAVDVTDWENYNAPLANEYDVVIGQGPAFEASCRKKSPQCTRIYLGTTEYVEHLVRAEKDRLERLWIRRGLKCRRRCYAKYKHDTGPMLSDALFLVGSDTTVDTYREVVDRPIYRHATTVGDDIVATVGHKRYETARKNFLWLASYAAVHRGLDVLLEVFSDMPDHDLWVCGGIEYEHDFMAAYDRELRHTSNIHFVGWIDVTSGQFSDLTARCAYIIYPSASEGMAGSVLNCMAAGLIPIVTLEAGVDTAGHGKLISECSPDVIRQIIRDAAMAEPAELEREARAVVEFTRKRYSKEAFLEAFRANLRAALHIPP
jgi:glycosyltransferase involved in cell wall biosynthesis